MAEADHKIGDREVALILRRAVEMERLGATPEDVRGSLTLAELREIAREVGINPEAIDVAASELGLHADYPKATWLGPPSTRKATRMLAAHLCEEDLKLLVRAVERRLKRAGLVSEAFGQVRWVSVSAQLTTEVAITAGEKQARIDVEQHYPSRMRPLLHLIPGALGVTIAVSLGAPAGLIGAPLLALAMGGGVVGVGIGRTVWHLVAMESKRSTKKLADELAASASELSSTRARVGEEEP